VGESPSGSFGQGLSQRGVMHVTILYFFDDNRVGILLHGFSKDTEAIEEHDKQLGIARMKAHLQSSQKTEKKKVKKGRK
jgi:hypothetical protein